MRKLRNLLCFEWKRGMYGRGMKIALLLGVVLAIAHFIGFETLHRFNVKFSEQQKLANGDYGVGIYPNTLYESFIGGEGYTVFYQLYYYMIPIFAVLPFGTSFYRDEKSGYLKLIYTKAEKKYYLIAKFLSVFGTGAIASGFPYVFSFFLTSLDYPAILPNQMALQTVVQDMTMLSQFYYSSPWFYFLCYWMIVMAFGGLMATLALCASFRAKNRLVVFFFPFLFYIALDYVLLALHLSQWSFLGLVNPQNPSAHNHVSPIRIMVYWGVVLIIEFLFFWKHGTKREEII